MFKKKRFMDLNTIKRLEANDISVEVYAGFLIISIFCHPQGKPHKLLLNYTLITAFFLLGGKLFSRLSFVISNATFQSNKGGNFAAMFYFIAIKGF